jgi:hypothetical protein
MNTREQNERLHGTEALRPSHETETPHDDATALSQAAAMFDARKDMLASIEADIEPSLFGALADKIEHEYASLVALMEGEAKAIESKRKLDRVLKSEYFTRKRLDLDL